MELDPTIFKAYDIRGFYPEQINSKMSYHIGRAVSTHLSPNRMMIGRDMRRSSNEIYGELIAGFLDSGVNVVDIGLTSTDQFYHACAELESSGVMVTASHNPPKYGGFKIVEKIPYMLGWDGGLEEIYDLILKEEYLEPEKKGQLIQSDVKQSFVNKIFSIVEPRSIAPIKIVADTGNGMAGPILQYTYSYLPQIDLVHINPKPNGISPNHGWDPLQKENHRQLQKKVIDENAQLGFAFDGDGDRFFVIDEKGNFVPGGFLTALFAQHILTKFPKSKVIYDVRSSWAIPDQIKKYGGIPIEERVGHTFIKKRMVKENAAFGGEGTGHYYFRDFHFSDSGILPSLMFLEFFSGLAVPLSDILAKFHAKYVSSGEINLPVKDMSKTLEMMEKIEKTFIKKARIEKRDGISVIFKNWHFNLRLSNTEPLLRLNLEAKSQVMLKQKIDLLLSLLSE